MKVLISKWVPRFLLLLLCVAGVSILRKHVGHAPDGCMIVQSDVLAYVSAARNMVDGSDIYLRPGGESNSYVYLPFLAWALIPLVPLHPLAIDIGWFVVNLILVAVVIRASYYLFRGKRFASLPGGTRWLLASGAIVFSLRYLVRNAQDANINLLICSLIVGGIYLMRTRRTPGWAGLLGIAAAIKILPALFVIYFAARREWKAAGWLIAGAVVASVLPITVIGYEKFAEYFLRFVGYTQAQFSPQGLEIENFSVWGLLGRLFTHSPAFWGPDGQAEYVNIANLPLPFVRVAVYLLNIVMLILFYRMAREEVHSERETENAGLVAGLLVMNLVSILTEDHHTVSYLVATLYLLLPWQEGRTKERWVSAFAVAAGLLSLLLSYEVVVPLWGRTAYNVMMSYSLPVLPAGLLLLIGTYLLSGPGLRNLRGRRAYVAGPLGDASDAERKSEGRPD
jgi:alpha-1,2-mannosyltransferase